jgi:hypothetical protein
MNLRRVLTALAVLALFVGLASAQVPTPTPINCSVTAAVPTLRSQGVMERPGDVIINCTGGPTPTAGNAVDRATVQISFAGVPISNATNNDGVSISGAGQNSTDALLLIDEPNDGGGPVGGYGQNANIVVCSAASQAGGVGCPAYAQQINGYWVMDTSGTPGVPAGHAANAYQGVTPSASGGNTVLTFQNVPVLSTGTTTVSRVYRLVNTRLTPGSNASITASVTITPVTNAVTTLNLTNNAVTAGAVASGITTSVSTTGGATLCATTKLNPSGNQAKANLALMTFTEGFGSAFKTRVLPISTSTVAQVASNAGPYYQNAANGNYVAQYTPAGGTATTVALTSQQSESGVVLPAGSLTGLSTAGLAGGGTRFKAVFTKLASNVTYYVSLVNVADYSDEATPPATVGDGTPLPYAVAIANNNPSTSNPKAMETAAASVYLIGTGNNANTSSGNPTGVRVIQLVPDTGGNAEVVWEVTNQTAAVDTFNFAFYAEYNNVTSAPAVGTDGLVALSFAPTSGTSGSSTTSTNTFIPRFNNGTVAAVNAFVVVPCQTTLLFPFVTTTKVTATQHWDTGIAIANTGADPWNSVPVPVTPATNTYCTLTFFGSGVSSGLNTASQFTPPSVNTPAIGPGQTYAFDASDPLSIGTGPNVGFAGYMFAVCNFEFAHGFAYIEDGAADSSGVGNSMGYLALVVNNITAVQRAAALTGEGLLN